MHFVSSREDVRSESSAYVWHPSPEHIARANVTRLARHAGAADLADLRARSVADVEWYWDAAIRDLELPFRTPYTRVLDTSRGIEHPDWFTGSTLNVVDACVTRWQGAADRDRAAVIHETEDGTVTKLSFGDLAHQVARAAAGLARLGVRRGDAVALFLPMIPEAAVAVYAVAALGAVLVPLFSGFAPQAISARIHDAEAKVAIVAAATTRRGRRVPLKAQLDEALADCPTVEHVVVIGGTDDDPASRVPETRWDDLLATSPADQARVALDPVALDPTEPLLLGYTSGTTGRPKGAVHTHPGFLVKTATEIAYSFDQSPGDVFFWVTDLGWIMGPLSLIGSHANGATVVLYEGSPDVPDIDRLWHIAERHRATMLGVSPTLIRTLRAARPEGPQGVDLSSVRVIGSSGEPWDPSAYDWLARDVFGGRVPIINFSGGTEVGGSFLAPYPVQPIASCSVGGPSLGMDVDVVDDTGASVRGVVGELVCRQPWPSMTRGVWRDDERYLESYWRRFPGVWHHGDFALVDPLPGADQWYVLGRSDDVMNVAGKRLAPAEVEAALNAHPAVAESAVVGVPDSTKGEAVWAFWVARDSAGADVSSELAALVGAQLGKPFTPSLVRPVSALPKTRSQKILRRAIRAAALHTDPGDLSSAENPAALDEIAAAVGDAQPK
ncbi:AMP-binding protein [Microbacterium aurum]